MESRKESRPLRKDAAVYEKYLAKALPDIDEYVLDNVIKKNVYKCAVKIIKAH